MVNDYNIVCSQLINFDYYNDLFGRATIVLLIVALIGGFILLVWSAERFITGASGTAEYFGMPPLLIGIVIVGFGTSAPEMVVSAQAALAGNPDLALGNALGSNIVNTGLVLGVTALLAPIVVHSNIVRKEIPILIAIGLLFGAFLFDGFLTRIESVILLSGFFAVVGWAIYSAMREQDDHLGADVEQVLEAQQFSLQASLFWLLAGLCMLILSSRVLVWGAVGIAEQLGVSNLIIGLTIVALGTSLPELAASVIAAKKGQHDIAIGNVVGSNMFNILAVAGIAGVISPMSDISPAVLLRDWSVMMGLTIGLLVMAYGYGKQGAISRLDGSLLLIAFVAYNFILLQSV